MQAQVVDPRRVEGDTLVRTWRWDVSTSDEGAGVVQTQVHVQVPMLVLDLVLVGLCDGIPFMWPRNLELIHNLPLGFTKHPMGHITADVASPRVACGCQ